MKFTDKFASLLVSGILHLIALMPLRLGQAVGRMIGRGLFYFDTRAAKVTLTNLELCMPELGEDERRDLARESLLQTGQMMMESPAAWLGSFDRIYGWIKEVRGEALLKSAVDQGHGVIILLPHIGNWELINVYFAARGDAVGAVKRAGLYAPPGKPYLKRIMSEIRGRFGNEMVPTTLKGIARLIQIVDEGGLTVVLPDQVPAKGEFAPFFGHMALTDKLIPRMVKRTGAKVLCCVIERLPDAGGFILSFTEPHADIYDDDPTTSLRGLNESVELCAIRLPAQYQWEYKRFRERPPGELRLYNYKRENSTYH